MKRLLVIIVIVELLANGILAESTESISHKSQVLEIPTNLHTNPDTTPGFVGQIKNVTVIQGRDANFSCTGQHLGEHVLEFLTHKKGAKAPLAIQNVQDPRFSVSRNGENSLTLYIQDVKKEDGGVYMCQINTQPIIKVAAHLEVLVPPKIVFSKDLIQVRDGETATLICRSSGHPKPRIIWEKEDGTSIIIKTQAGNLKKVKYFHGENLILSRITRNQTGDYLCTAANGVSPPASQRITVEVNDMNSHSDSSEELGSGTGSMGDTTDSDEDYHYIEPVEQTPPPPTLTTTDQPLTTVNNAQNHYMSSLLVTVLLSMHIIAFQN